MRDAVYYVILLCEDRDHTHPLMSTVAAAAQGREVIVDADTTLGPEFEGRWTPVGVKQIQSWVDEAALLSACHNESANFFNLMFRVAGTGNIVSAAAAGALSYLAVGSNCESNTTPRLSSLTLFSSLSVLAAGINAFFAWNLRSMLHLIMSNEYGTLSKDLAYQLSLPMHAREDILLVFARTSAKLKEVSMRAPIIPPWITSQVKSGKRGCCAWMFCCKRKGTAVSIDHVI